MRDDDDDIDLDPEQSAVIERLLDQCVSWLLADADPQRFMARMAEQGPALFPQLLEAQGHVRPLPGSSRDAEGDALSARFFRSFGWAVVSAMPLPANGFKPRKLPLPGRNDACICGSGRKFKHCCSPLFESLPGFRPDMLAALVLPALPRKQWATLPDSGIAPAMVIGAADVLREEGRIDDALRLLQPWAECAAPWPDNRAELLDLLGDLYLDLGKPRKRKQLAQAMIDKGERQVQSMGWQRQAMMAADAGDAAGARSAFERAQRLTPDAPRLALLEVTTLLGTGQMAQALQRADFHIRRLQRQPPDDETAHTIETLQAIQRGDLVPPDDDENPALDSIDPHSSFSQLLAAIQRLPAPQLRLKLPADGASDLHALWPDAGLAPALQRWRKAFPGGTPAMAGMPSAIDFDRAFAPDERWSSLFKSTPVLADSFEVLDDLLSLLEVLPPELAAEPQVTLLLRAMVLWDELRRRQPRAACEWAHLDNRPALRLLLRWIQLDASPTAERAFDWLQHLVTVLNPHDNHGQRERLAAVYLRRGLAEQALQLIERYPDDFVGLQLLHARSLLALQRFADAQARFAAALKLNPHVLKLLLARSKPRLPKVDSYRVGSAEQARFAVALQHDLWAADKAVAAWVRAHPANIGGKPTTAPLFDDGAG